MIMTSLRHQSVPGLPWSSCIDIHGSQRMNTVDFDIPDSLGHHHEVEICVFVFACVNSCWEVIFGTHNRTDYNNVSDFLKATLCRYWHFCAIWRLPQFLSATPLWSIWIPALYQLLTLNVSANYKQNPLHHNNVMWWNLIIKWLQSCYFKVKKLQNVTCLVIKHHHGFIIPTKLMMFPSASALICVQCILTFKTSLWLK